MFLRLRRKVCRVVGATRSQVLHMFGDLSHILKKSLQSRRCYMQSGTTYVWRNFPHLAFNLFSQPYNDVADHQCVFKCRLLSDFKNIQEFKMSLFLQHYFNQCSFCTIGYFEFWKKKVFIFRWSAFISKDQGQVDSSW